MSVRRLLVLWLLSLLCLATVAAQSSPGKSALEKGSSSAASETKKDSPETRSLDSKVSEARAQQMFAHMLTLERNDSICYTLRTYRVARLSPNSDATEPAGYSSCLSSSRIQLKTAVDTIEIASH
jgi:hypothetical protein